MGVPPTRSRTDFAIFLSVIHDLLDVVPGADGLDRPVSLGKVCNACCIENTEDGVPDGGPHIALGAATVFRAGTPFVEAVTEQDGAAECLEHFGHANLIGIADQCVTALGAADAANEASPTKRRQKLFEIGLRDALTGRDVCRLRRAGVAVPMSEAR